MPTPNRHDDLDRLFPPYQANDNDATKPASWTKGAFIIVAFLFAAFMATLS